MNKMTVEDASIIEGLVFGSFAMSERGFIADCDERDAKIMASAVRHGFVRDVVGNPQRGPYLIWRNDPRNPINRRPTERERIEMCGPDPVRNSDLGL